MSKPKQQTDLGLQVIDAFERAMIEVHDQKAAFGVAVEELARQRPGVVQFAKNICDQLRAEHRARTHHD